MTLAPVTEHELADRIEDLTAKVDRLASLIEAERTALALQERDVDLPAVTDLLLRLIEAAPDLDRAIETFVSLAALTDDVEKLTGEVFEAMVRGLDELDRRGYFTFAKGGLAVIDEIVTSFDEDDIQALGDNVVLILETIKEMTQPEAMQMLQRSFSMMRDGEEPRKLSMFRLLREMRDPEVKRGLHRMLTLLVGLATAPEEDESITETETEEA